MRHTVELQAGADPTLAGNLHLPADRPVAAVIMVPGSGPSDRDNAGYFPPIRDGLLNQGFAVASFDKRGVGGSEGDWRDTGPAEQTSDVIGQLEAVRAVTVLAGVPVGLFGHSQGGWVVLDVAAAAPTISFVVTNSGPGVTWARQGRYATEADLVARATDAAAISQALAGYDAIVSQMRAGADYDTVQALAESVGLADGSPGDAQELELVRRWLDHDPRPALERIGCPVLALFGAEDRLVPVEESAAVFRAARLDRSRPPDVEIFAGATHRLQVGDPPQLHEAYLPTLAGWILRTVESQDR